MKETIEKQKALIDHMKDNKHLPQQFYDWMLANCLDDRLRRHPRYIAYALKAQEAINKITCDPILFCVADPEHLLRKV